MRFLLIVPLLPLLLPFFRFVGLAPLVAALFQTPLFTSPWSFFLLLYGYAGLSTLLLTQAIRRTTAPDASQSFARRMSFVVVGAMALMVLGAFLLSFYFLIVAPLAVRLLFLPGMGVALLIAIHALFSHRSAPDQAARRPKDASPLEGDWSQEPRGERG